ncbi:hypothetical protein MRBLMN1_004918 [Chitinophaga ginsengisegetis]|uniref:M57 family metalloprotease n=1 Tax=Chitinophaga ginsengisegetis TaxID=393003 RepID=UPI0034421EAA
MKLLTKILVCLTTGIVVLSSCKKDHPDDHKIPAATISRISALGFDTLNVTKVDGGYVVEGDIFLTENDLETRQGYTTLSIGESDQYKFSYTLNALPREINISVSGLPAAYVTATEIAIARYNALNLRVTFKKVTSSANADIEIRDNNLGNTTLARTPAYPAVPRNPSSPVLLNVAALGNSPDENRLATLITHQIGHAIGLRHTTYANNPYSCTYNQVDRAGNNQVELININGTPTTGAAYSWMLGCMDSGDHPFNPNDVVALNYFYGNTPGDFAVPAAAYRRGTKELHLFLRSKTNTLLEKTYIPGTGWSAWKDLGGTLTSDPGAASKDENSIDVFVRGTANNLLYKTWTTTGGWSDWKNLGGNLTSAPAAESRAPGLLNIFAKGANNVLQTIYYGEGAGWLYWQNFNVTVISAASATSRYPTSIEMYARGEDNQLVQGVWTRESDRTVWNSVGGYITSAPSAVARGFLTVDIFALGVNHNLITTNWSVTSAWKTWESIGANIYSAPATASADSLSVDIFAKGPSDNLMQRTWTKAAGYGPWINL